VKGKIMSTLSTAEVIFYEIFLRQNPNVELPVDPGKGIDDPQPVPPDREPEPPVKIPPDQPGLPEEDPNPTPIGDPVPDGPTRLV
jgi:hypothetical protein